MKTILEVPSWLKYVHKLTGSIQFPVDDSAIDRHTPPFLWPIPLYAFYIFVSAENLTNYEYVTYRGKSTLTRYVYSLGLFTSMLSMCVNMVELFRRRSKVEAIVAEISMLRSQSPTWKRRRRRMCSYVFIAIFAIVTTLEVTVNISKRDVFMINSQMVLTITHVVNAMEMFFTKLLLDDLKAEFQGINVVLESTENAVDLAVLFPMTETEKLERLDKETAEFNLGRIEAVSMHQYRLVKAANGLNEVFGVSIMGSIAVWFILITVMLYYSVQLLIRFPMHVFYSFLKPLTIWLSSYFGYVFLEVWVLTSTQEEANQASTCVHNLWNKWTSSGPRPDEKIRSLQLFSIRLLNSKLQFSALHFFPLDWSLFRLAASSIAMYVIVFTQFGL